MFDSIKKAAFIRRHNRFVANALIHGDLVEFDDEFYKKFDGKILSGLPVAVRIKYYLPVDKADDKSKLRAELLTYGLPKEAKVMCAQLRSYEIEFGEGHAKHCWVEHAGWCFDPTLLCMVRKPVFYAIEQPYVNTITEICKDRFDNPEYADTYAGNIEKYYPGGEKRSEVNAAVMVLTEPSSGSMTAFGHEMRKFLKAVKI